MIRIFREHIEKVPDDPKKAEILSKIIRRISDEEEGVRKLSHDVLQTYWFTPSDKGQVLQSKVICLMDAIIYLLEYNKDLENFFKMVLITENVDKKILVAAGQMVNTLVYFALNPEIRHSLDPQISAAQRMAALTALSIISKLRPRLITSNAETLSHIIQPKTSIQVLHQIINILEKVIPLIEHPTEQFFMVLDERLCDIIKNRGCVLIQSASACLGAVCKRWKPAQVNVSKIFLQYLSKFVSYILCLD